MDMPRSATAEHRRALKKTLILTLGFACVQAATGWFTNSLALLADAGHMVADAGGVALALFASWIAQKPATPARTYGYYRVEILAALLNGLVLLLLALFILYEAAQRFTRPEVPISVGPMLLVATLGLGVNLYGVWNLQAGAGESLNLKGAFLEVLSDALGSVGAIVAGLIMWATHWYYADALFSTLLGLFILPRTGQLLWEAVNVLLEGTPAHISIAAVEEAMRQVPGVDAVHDLHVWTITSGIDALSAHVVLVEGTAAEEAFGLIDQLHDLLRQQFGIQHSTVQVERQDRREREMCR